jgi:glycosyltransferase involved in cell wall biosynthesis
MNILILTTHLNPGGISRYVLSLAKGLHTGHNIYLASSGGSWESEFRSYQVRIKRLPLNTKSILSPKILISFLSLISFVKQNKIEVIHANTRVTQMVAFLIYKTLGISYLSSFHGFYKPHLMRKLIKLQGVRSIAVSRAVKQDLVDNLKFNPEIIDVVYNGIDRNAFSIKKRRRRQEYGFNRDCLVLGILGRISQEKGHRLALDAFLKLTNEYPHLYLLFCGQGKLKPHLESVVRRYNLSAKVKFLDLDANHFLDLLDILIVPSSKEGFGYSAVEGFLKGVPVLGFNTGGLAEIIKDGENGFLFYRYNSSSLAVKLKEIIDNPELREKIMQQALVSVNDFSYKKMAAETLKSYRRAIGV